MYFGSFAEKYFMSLVPVLAPVFNIVNRFYHVNVILVHFDDATLHWNEKQIFGSFDWTGVQFTINFLKMSCSKKYKYEGLPSFLNIVAFIMF